MEAHTIQRIPSNKLHRKRRALEARLDKKYQVNVSKLTNQTKKLCQNTGRDFMKRRPQSYDASKGKRVAKPAEA